MPAKVFLLGMSGYPGLGLKKLD